VFSGYGTVRLRLRLDSAEKWLFGNDCGWCRQFLVNLDMCCACLWVRLCEKGYSLHPFHLFVTVLSATSQDGPNRSQLIRNYSLGFCEMSQKSGIYAKYHNIQDIFVYHFIFAKDLCQFYRSRAVGHITTPRHSVKQSCITIQRHVHEIKKESPH